VVVAFRRIGEETEWPLPASLTDAVLYDTLVNYLISMARHRGKAAMNRRA